MLIPPNSMGVTELMKRIKRSRESSIQWFSPEAESSPTPGEPESVVRGILGYYSGLVSMGGGAGHPPVCGELTHHKTAKNCLTQNANRTPTALSGQSALVKLELPLFDDPCGLSCNSSLGEKSC